MRFTESVLAYKRPRVLIIAGAMIAVIALLDWKVATEVSFGFLYFFPVFLVASCYGQWQIAVVAAICTFFREGLGHFDPTYRFSRLFLAWGSFTAAGWLVRGVLANFQKVRDQLVEIQARDRLRVGFRRSAEQEQAIIFLQRQLNQQRRQVRTGDPFGQRIAEQP